MNRSKVGIWFSSTSTHLSVTLVLLAAVLSLGWSGHTKTASPRDNNSGWKSFQRCLAETGAASITDTFACLPDDCRWQYLNSASAQHSCRLVLGGDSCSSLENEPKIILPRLVLTCSNGDFMPTYGFCAKQDTLEIATYQTKTEIHLYDLVYQQDKPVITQVHALDDSRNCRSCHFVYDPDQLRPYIHTAIPVNNRLVLGEGRRSDYIKSLCKSVRTASVRGCEVSGTERGESFVLDESLLLSFCQVILHD